MSQSIARPNFGPLSAKWATERENAEKSLDRRLALLEGAVQNNYKQQASGFQSLGRVVYGQTPPQMVQGFGSTTVGAGPGDDAEVIPFGVKYTMPDGYDTVNVLFSFHSIFSDGSTTGLNLVNEGVCVSTVPNWVADPTGTWYTSDQVESVLWGTGDRHITISVSGALKVTEAMLGQRDFYLGGLVSAASATPGAYIDCYSNGSALFLFSKD